MHAVASVIGKLWVDSSSAFPQLKCGARLICGWKNYVFDDKLELPRPDSRDHRCPR
jgi:hypothetical protein